MTDPDPDKRPQRARDVVAILAKSRPPERDPEPRTSTLALERPRSRELAQRRLFGDIGEPIGTILRLGVLGFGASGWMAMAGVRLSLFITMYIAAALAFPARGSRKVVGVGRELDSMLAEGQTGFTDMMRGAMARR